MSKKKTNKVISDKIICSCCGKNTPSKDFYFSGSPFQSHTNSISTCKECFWSFVSDDINKLKVALRMVDKPFLVELLKASQDEAEKTNKNHIKIYMKNLGMPQYRYLTWDDSDFEGHIHSNQKSHTNVIEQSEDSTFVQETKIYSKIWLGYYLPSEIEYLEEYLKGLDRDFRIVTLSHRDYAKKIAKASLHMDKCFQEMQDGVSGADKKYKEAKDIFDTLSKSAKFSESQRGITDVGMGSISQIVEMVESETWVYEHKNDLDKDTYDKLIDDFKHIYKSL